MSGRMVASVHVWQNDNWCTCMTGCQSIDLHVEQNETDLHVWKDDNKQVNKYTDM